MKTKTTFSACLRLSNDVTGNFVVVLGDVFDLSLAATRQMIPWDHTENVLFQQA